jgi:hypothetical protein
MHIMESEHRLEQMQKAVDEINGAPNDTSKDRVLNVG